MMRVCCAIGILCVLGAFAFTACGDSDSSSNANGDTGAGAGGQGGMGGAAGTAGSGGSGGTGTGGTGFGGAGGNFVFPPGCSASAPPFSPSTLPAGTVGDPYDEEFVLIGAWASQLIWRVDGDLPMGLELTPSKEDAPASDPRATARLHGTPTTAGTSYFTVTVGLAMQPACAAAPAVGSYELVIVEPDADAGT